MLGVMKLRLLSIGATFLNYFSLYGFNYRKLLSDITYERLFIS
jgi:hypothetical protein